MAKETETKAPNPEIQARINSPELGSEILPLPETVEAKTPEPARIPKRSRLYVLGAFEYLQHPVYYSKNPNDHEKPFQNEQEYLNWMLGEIKKGNSDFDYIGRTEAESLREMAEQEIHEYVTGLQKKFPKSRVQYEKFEQDILAEKAGKNSQNEAMPKKAEQEGSAPEITYNPSSKESHAVDLAHLFNKHFRKSSQRVQDVDRFMSSIPASWNYKAIEAVNELYKHYGKDLNEAKELAGDARYGDYGIQRLLSALAHEVDWEKRPEKFKRIPIGEKITPKDRELNQQRDSYLNRLNEIIGGYMKDLPENEKARMLQETLNLRDEVNNSLLFGTDISIPENQQGEELRRSFYDAIALLQGERSLTEQEQADYIEHLLGEFLDDAVLLAEVHKDPKAFKEALVNVLAKASDKETVNAVFRINDAELLKVVTAFGGREPHEGAEQEGDFLEYEREWTEFFRYAHARLHEAITEAQAGEARLARQYMEEVKAAQMQIEMELQGPLEIQYAEKLRKDFEHEHAALAKTMERIEELLDGLATPAEQAPIPEWENMPVFQGALADAKELAWTSFKNEGEGEESVMKREFERMWLEDLEDIKRSLKEELDKNNLL